MRGQTHGGKGASPRPPQVSQQQIADNWELIFGKKNKATEPKDDKDGTPILPGQ